VATDYYALLGVSSSASTDEIKRAYRRLAREFHPDANRGDPATEDRFKEVARAYEVLSDPERRRRYDLFGPEEPAGAGRGDPFGGMGGAGFGDLFDAFFGGSGVFGQGGGSPFGGRGRASGPVRGADMEVALDLDFEEAVFGVERDVSLRVPVTCRDCDGSGARSGTAPVTCPDCGGAGQVRRVRQSILGQMVTAVPCPRCGARGRVIEDPCPTCRGEGRRTEERAWTVQVPAGVDAGTTLRLAGRGAAGPRGGPAGDLYVHLRVASSPVFERVGSDLHSTQHIPMTSAALGATVETPTLEGEDELDIAPGTQTGAVLRLRGHGVPSVEGRGRGDLLVTVVVDTPTDPTPSEEELLRRLAEERGDEVAPPGQGLLSRLRSAFK
jgi:molecular chaperone DnaJ